jgi:RimJ/RimL family protein N-acetyltransferase
MIIIETERLILREMVLEDAKDMFRLHSNPEVQRYTGEDVITSLEDIPDKIKEFQNRDKNLGFGRWITILKKENQVVGWSGLAYLPEFNDIDIGYRFLPEYWGIGIATEASRAILSYGFNSLKLKKIIAIAYKENEASIKVMKKVGMQFDKLAPYEPGGENVVWYWCNKDHI